MSWPNDWLTGLCLFLFAFGLIFSVISLVFNVGDDLPGVDLDGDPSNNHQGGAPSPFSISTIMIFFTWFGAAGYIARVWGALTVPVVLAIAAVAGLAGGALVWLFLAKFLWHGERTLDPAAYDVHGTLARVTSPIRADGTGEIVYTIDGKRRVDGARAVEGIAIPLGADVAIVRYEAGLAYVAPLDWAEAEGGFLGAPGAPPFIPATDERRAGERR
jgi:membrane protein implicated in regulation of membrane protease activity